MEPPTCSLDEGRDWLGRGGLMGFPWIAFPSHLASFVTRVRVYAFSALWLSIALQYFIWQLPLLLLCLLSPLDGGRAYLRCCTCYDYVALPSVLCVPYSWCGFRVHTCDYERMLTMAAKGKSSLVMTNHSSRIDWLVGMLLGRVVKPSIRIGFVAEVTTMLMPVFGWSRGLFGDIFLRRTFHRDAVRIRENIKVFHDAGVERMIFVAPEGAIVDPGVAKDFEYVAQCREFMTELGKAPLEYLLTPRYKGVQLLVEHAPTDVFSVTMAFVYKEARGRRWLGTYSSSSLNCTKPLKDPNRVIPDLHTIFRGGLHVYCEIQHLDLPTTAKSEVVRDTLMQDYERKDKLLANFDAHNHFDNSRQMRQLPIHHLTMNLTLVGHTLFSAWFLNEYAGVSPLVFFYLCSVIVAFIFVSHSLTHLYAEKISGASRESLLFETVFKALLQKYMGGKLDHGDSTSKKQEKSAKKNS